MIDHMDKQTQPMDLEPKRGRGRPATGQALSNADRQRAYRERQKAQRNENTHRDVAKDLREMLAQAIERAELAEQEVEVMKLTAENDRKDLALKDLQLREWIRRAEEAERELEQRNGKTFWHVEMCEKGKRTWKRVGGEDTQPFESKASAEAFMEKMKNDGATPEWKWRVVPA